MDLSIKNLHKSFEDKIILTDFSYDFAQKGIYLIKGNSGIGKTTLLRMISGLDTDFEGVIANGGIKNVSYMFQEYRLFPTLSALKNVTAAAVESEENTAAAKSLLIRLGISEADWQKRPNELSGGMKQRVAFARAVLKSAPILILDEPTKELDENSVVSMCEIIIEEAEKRLIIIVSHENLAKISEMATVIQL